MSARNKPSSVPFRGRIIHLGSLLPATSSSLPGTQTERATPRPLFGLATSGVYRATSVASGPVRSYRTFSPLPVPQAAIGGLILCGTFRRLTTPGRYPAPCPVELGLSSRGRSHRRSSLATLNRKTDAYETGQPDVAYSRPTGTKHGPRSDQWTWSSNVRDPPGSSAAKYASAAEGTLKKMNSRPSPRLLMPPILAA